MRLIFYLLYHPFAFLYDLVAATVSLGHWNNWVLDVLPFIEGTRVLELGHGPGHLQRALLERGLDSVGLDESRQMANLAKKRLAPNGKLTRGRAQFLPFPNETFSTVISTFPAEYIFDARTHAEAGRCLLNGGRLIVLPVAWPNARFLQWLYKVTGETKPNAREIVEEKIGAPLKAAGFEVEIKTLESKSGRLLAVLARKSFQNLK